MAWKFDNDRSIYVQLVEQIKKRIITGEYQPGSKLSSVRELAGEAEVNPNTMQRALASLEDMGLVHAVRTSGRFVTEDQNMIEQLRKNSAIELAEEFRKKMKEIGFSQEEMIAFLREDRGDHKEETV